MPTPTHTLHVLIDDDERLIEAEEGANLRRVLLAHGISPYAALTQRLNCGGRGLCATCGVWVESGIPAPSHWHDRLAGAFGYPRLSCQITIHAPMTVRILTDKVIWGGRDPARRYDPDAGSRA